MGSFKLELKTSLEHDLKKIDRQFIPKILDAIDNLSQNPFPTQSKKLQGTELTYRLRVGDYRVIYQVDGDNNIITVFHVRHRKDAYRE